MFFKKKKEKKKKDTYASWCMSHTHTGEGESGGTRASAVISEVEMGCINSLGEAEPFVTPTQHISVDREKSLRYIKMLYI